MWVYSLLVLDFRLIAFNSEDLCSLFILGLRIFNFLLNKIHYNMIAIVNQQLFLYIRIY